MKVVQAAEAKAKFSALLSDVERGAVIDITRHGKTIARLMPPSEADARAKRETAAAWILENKRTGRLTGVTIDEILSARDEGRP